MLLLVIATVAMALALVALAAGVVRYRRQTSEELKALRDLQQKDESFQLLNQNVLGLRQSVDLKIKEVNDRLGTAVQAFSRVQRGLGRLDKLGESVDELQSLLGSQKLRGNLGEQVMVDLLKDFIPADIRETQVTLSSGVRVDAVVRTSEGKIPIDAKFPLENYQRASKAGSSKEREAAMHELHKNARKHVRDIATKYICPGETVDFAVMYVPSEAVYDAIQEDPDVATAAQKRVFIVCPTNFCALLSLIMLNLEGERLAGEARNVMNALRGIQRMTGKYEDQLQVAAGHVRKAHNAMGTTTKQWEELKGSIDGAAELESPRVEELDEAGSSDDEQHLRAVR